MAYRAFEEHMKITPITGWNQETMVTTTGTGGLINTGKGIEAAQGWYWKCGDLVYVRNWGEVYSSLPEAAERMGLKKYGKGNSPPTDHWKRGDEATIVAVGLPPWNSGCTSGKLGIRFEGLDYIIGYRGISLLHRDSFGTKSYCDMVPTTDDGIALFNTQHALINQQNTMLTAIAKRLFDADTKKLIKAGYLDTCLNLTEKGKNMMWAILLEKTKEDLLKAAEEEINESSKEK